ncbi:MAG TPA: septal ring lytic transglycosylase RlpA family protein [Steroidobacteraceae bacterium]|nr:septal ring lytic transglycosylase RlpA family protein [Steroidobacteraceae bacterium]
MSTAPRMDRAASPFLATALALVALSGCSLTRHREAPAPAPPPVVPAAPPDLTAIPDAVPRAEPRSAHGNPPFYDVFGRRYYVLASADGYLERGVASWYGPTFHGGNTSSGEPYDMYAMTAAHKTVPLPCYARVTNLRNGKNVVVRINDRGPFVANRLIDLSYTAAARLDMLREGTTLVEVRVLSPSVPDVLTRSSAEPPPALYVQAGAFADQQNAQRLLERLQAAGLERAFIALPLQTGTHLYRVRLGPVESVAQFDELAARLAALGIADARLALE